MCFAFRDQLLHSLLTRDRPFLLELADLMRSPHAVLGSTSIAMIFSSESSYLSPNLDGTSLDGTIEYPAGNKPSSLSSFLASLQWPWLYVALEVVCELIHTNDKHTGRPSTEGFRTSSQVLQWMWQRLLIPEFYEQIAVALLQLPANASGVLALRSVISVPIAFEVFESALKLDRNGYVVVVVVVVVFTALACF
jgi:hypothetical protein